MSAERVRVTFPWRCGELVSYTQNPRWPYRIAQQRFTKAEGVRQWIEYGIVRVGDADAAVLLWVTPAELRVWRWASHPEETQ